MQQVEKGSKGTSGKGSSSLRHPSPTNPTWVKWQYFPKKIETIAQGLPTKFSVLRKKKNVSEEDFVNLKPNTAY